MTDRQEENVQGRHGSPAASGRRRVACIGAGPAGLLAATHIKNARPDWEVVVHERQPKDVTYGYGVVFSDVAVRTIDYMAPALGELLAEQTRWEDIEIRAKGRRYRIPGHGYAALSRHRLIGELAQHAIGAGVTLRYETPVELDELRGEFDLIIAADGARSRTRQALAAELGASVGRGRSRFAWLGTTATFDAMTFIFEQTAEGAAIAHGYPHGDGLSTFVVEVPGGSRVLTGDSTAPGEIDLAAWSDFFSEHLGGHRLQARGLRWDHFPAIRLERCVHENVVVIGDAAHTVHYSVGSGTRLALEDAFLLARTLARVDDLPRALAEYERRRLPMVRELQTAGERSMRWFENAPMFLDDPARFSVHLLSRTAHVDLDGLAAEAGPLVDDARAAYGGARGGSVLRQPVDVGGLRLPSRLVVETAPGTGAGTDATTGTGADAAVPVRPGLALGPCAPDGAVRGAVVDITALRSARRRDDGGPDLALLDLGPCPPTPERARRQAEFVVREVGGAGGADGRGPVVAVRTEADIDRSPNETLPPLLARLRVLHDAGLCALVDVMAPKGRNLGTDDAMTALETAGMVRAALGVPTMLSGFGDHPEQVEAHVLAGRIDLWCMPS
jgi:salicyloyl-CoA 5-hydroxylase